MELFVIILIATVALAGFAIVMIWKPKTPLFRLKNRPEDTLSTERGKTERRRRAAYGAARARTKLTKETPR